MKFILTLFTALVFAVSAQANSPKVLAVNATKSGGAWRFAVTIRHADTGWKHYADGWGVYLKNGTKLGYRKLAHPHVDEQPFTRSLSGVKIPKSVKFVIIRAHDKVHGTGKGFIFKLK